jgi:protein TonB
MGFREYLKNDKSRKRMRVSFGIAFLIHALVFAVGGLSLATQAEYGMAGAVASAAAQPPPPAEEQTVELSDDSEDPVPVKKIQPTPLPTTVPSPAAVAAAPAAPNAPTGGALEVPSYFRNPPPPYPAEARRLAQEGLVMIRVQVDAQGKVASALVSNTSGYALLDEAAMKTAGGWQFKPAHLAGIAVSTQVDVPIRFRLKNGR